MAEKKNGDILYADDFNAKQDKITNQIDLNVGTIEMGDTDGVFSRVYSSSIAFFQLGSGKPPILMITPERIAGENTLTFQSFTCAEYPNEVSTRLINISTPKNGTDAANKKYVDDKIAELTAKIEALSK